MGINLLTEKKNQDKINYKKFETIARSLGGKHFLIETYELLFQILESFIMNFKFKVCFNLESLTNSVLTNGKFFIDSNLKLEENIKFLVNMNLKLSTNFLSNKYQIENLAGNFSQFPFPEDPLPFNTTYHGFPTYYIDFKKSFVYRLPTDLACERFDIENSDLNNFLIKIKPVEKINEIKKIYLPVFVKNNYLQKEEFVLFGLLKYMQGSNDEKNTNMELFCFPWNFLEFCVIWEEISKFGMINENIVQKLNIYFQKVPIHYSLFFFNLFQF